VEKSIVLNSDQKAELRMAIPQQSDEGKLVHGYIEAAGDFKFRT